MIFYLLVLLIQMITFILNYKLYFNGERSLQGKSQSEEGKAGGVGLEQDLRNSQTGWTARAAQQDQRSLKIEIEESGLYPVN